MDTGIGAILREARNRRKVDLSEVEAAIKIRARFLRAMESEEWDVLPGGAYTRGFIRTYASFLGLDGERLADDYRRAAPSDGERVPKRVEPVPAAARRQSSPGRAGALVAVVSVGLVALLIGIGLAGGEDGGESQAPGAGDGEQPREEVTQTVSTAAKPGVAVRLVATGEVWVCLLGEGEQPLVEGEILAEGAEAGPFRSAGFELALGNGAIRLLVDGEGAEVPASSSPLGYTIDTGGELTELEEGERPDCE